MDLKNLVISKDVIQDADTLPSDGGSKILPSGLYPMTVVLAYMQPSQTGAMGLHVHLKHGNPNNTLRQTFWLTSGTAKGQRNYFVDQQGIKRLLPGMKMAEALSKITTDKSISELETEEKTVRLYDYTAKAEVPTQVNALMDMIGKKVLVGVLDIVENRRVNQNGQWVNSNERRQYNEVHTLFHPTGHTVTENDAKAEAKFHETWRAKFEGKEINKFKPVNGAESVPEVTSGSTPPPSLFS